MYENRVDRRRYALFSIWFTLFMFGLFVGGLYFVPLGVFVVTIYLTGPPWHYTGQNYGLALMFRPRHAETRRSLEEAKRRLAERDAGG